MYLVNDRLLSLCQCAQMLTRSKRKASSSLSDDENELRRKQPKHVGDEMDHESDDEPSQTSQDQQARSESDSDNENPENGKDEKNEKGNVPENANEHEENHGDEKNEKKQKDAENEENEENEGDEENEAKRSDKCHKQDCKASFKRKGRLELFFCTYCKIGSTCKQHQLNTDAEVDQSKYKCDRCVPCSFPGCAVDHKNGVVTCTKANCNSLTHEVCMNRVGGITSDQPLCFSHLRDLRTYILCACVCVCVCVCVCA